MLESQAYNPCLNVSMGLKDILSPVGNAAKSVVHPISGIETKLQGATAEAVEQVTLFANLTIIFLVLITLASITTAVVAVKIYQKKYSS